MHLLPNAGWIKKDRSLLSQRDMRYEMRIMNERDLDDIMELQTIAIQSLKDQEVFRTHPADYYLEHFQRGSYVIGTFTDDGLIAYSILYFPGDHEDNFGRDIFLPMDELNKVAQLATVAVHPAYRGNSLQKTMYSVSLDEAKRLGFQHACCMVSPKNHPSLRNIFSQGLFIKSLKMKFNCRLRYIMHKNLDYPHVVCSKEVRIDSTDVAGQISLLKKGFLGFKSAAHHRGFSIFYGMELRRLNNRW